jgi:hypothetical protein
MSPSVKCKELLRAKRVQSIGVTGLVTELDLEGVARKNLDDSADLPRRKPELWHVRSECNGVEKLNWRSDRHLLIA